MIGSANSVASSGFVKSFYKPGAAMAFQTATFGASQSVSTGEGKRLSSSD